MKKFCKILCLILSLLAIFSIGCKKENPLYSSVSELRSDTFEGSSDNFSLIACYGFKETPYANDAVTSAKVYSLSFRLLDKETDDAAYTLSLNFGGEIFSASFKLNPVTHSMTANIEIENFNLKQFSVSVSGGSVTETVQMNSTLPDGAMDYKTALDYLYNEQKELINVYTDENGNFNAEIYARIVVKNQKPYWYIGIASGNDNLKALLIDGFTGEVLAIREIF